MTRPIQYACDPAARYCECGHCHIPARTTDLDALKRFNRAATSFATALILVALIAAIFAVGLVNEESRLARQSITNQERDVTWK